MNEFKRNLVIGYTFSLLLLLVSSFASYISIRNLLRNSALVEHTNLIISKLEHTISLLKDAETGQRGFLLTGEEQFLEPYNGSLEAVYNDIKDLRTLMIDNELQQFSLIKLADIVENRMKLLQDLINKKKAGLDVVNEELRRGKMYMDDARKQVNSMEQREKILLGKSTEEANKFAQNSPILIIIAAVLSLLVTVISFIRVSRDFEKRAALQLQLAQKDREITRRLNIISGIAEKVSAGNYTIRIDDAAKDELGSLAISMNKMTGSLDKSFTLLAHKTWLQTGISQLNEKMLGDQPLVSVAAASLEALTRYTESDVGGFYCFNGKNLEFIHGYSFQPPPGKKTIEPGEGIAGQALSSKKIIVLKELRPAELIISYVAGEVKPNEVVAMPLIYEGSLKAVIILGTMKSYSDGHKEYLELVSENLAIVINTAETRKKLNELLQETQAQSEELSSQHAELENINSELETQSEKLKVSEEELKVQQEELMESNSELEERSRLLEERNYLVAAQNRDIERKAEQLEISAKYKSEFLANMSHELRTPLNSILLLSRLMADNSSKNLSKEQVEYANVIEGAGRSLLSLIDEILDLSKIESGRMDMDYAMVSVNGIAENMRSLFKPVADNKKIQLEILTDPGVPTHFETDVQRLEQVLKNLLSNALKFTSAGSVVLRISLAPNNKLSFAVKDTGIGIAKSQQQHVFEAFRQEDGSTRRNYGGTGLGLSISRELLKLLGGEIHLQSEQGQGSTFTVIVPMKKSSVSSPVVLQSHSTQKISSPEREMKQPARSTFTAETLPDDRNNINAHDKVILVIEDDIVFARALQDFTRQNGYKAIVASRGDEGLELAGKFRPMGILLDIYLPVMDGWEVMEALKSNAATRHIPVHVMSSEEAKHKSLSAGAVDFINKPIPPENMQEIFRRIELVINKTPKKVLIVEENSMHAKALSYFLEGNNINTDVTNDIVSGIQALQKADTDCVILDMGVPGKEGYAMLDSIKRTAGLENIPIIVFTGKSLSTSEEMRIKKYADSIVVKTAHSYKRLLDEVSLFLHLVETTSDSQGVLKADKKRRGMQSVLTDKKILVVDDDVRNIYSLTKAMEQQGISVVSAIDGKDALNQLKSNAGVHLILMDMMMPEMDGYETTRIIRNMPEYKNIPVIAVTAKAMTGDREKCIEAGASDYITKPIDTDQLMSLLRVWLYER